MTLASRVSSTATVGAPILSRAAAAVAAVTIVTYQSWFMPFFQPFFVGRVGFARLVFYALYGSLVLTSAAVLVTRPRLWRPIMPLAIAASFSLAATFLHPIGLVTRAYIIAMMMGGTVIVLMLASAPMALLKLSAAVTALNAALCFVDLPFPIGFSTTLGRPAGLALNPNVAAAGILLGAAASYRAVPKHLRLSFLALATGALVVTLSRSTLLAAAATAAIPALIELWRRVRRRQSLTPRLAGTRPAAHMTAGMVAWCGMAMVTNDYVGPMAERVVASSLSAAAALREAHQSIATDSRDALAGGAVVADRAPRPALAAVGPAMDAEPPAAAADVRADAAAPDAADPPSDAAQIAAMDARLSGEGGRNTVSARALFLERAMVVYRHDGFFGMGLEQAHPLVPHNTFMLFALAFGHLGWLIPIAIVGLAVRAARGPADWAVAVAATGVMLTSHDVLVTPSLLLPIAIGIGGMIAHTDSPARIRALDRSIALGAAGGVILFATGCIAIVLVAPSLNVQRLAPTAISSYRGVYLAAIQAHTFPGVFVRAIEPPRAEGATFLRADGRPLTRVEWENGARPPVAAGEYAVRDNAVVFAPADRSDPRTDDQVFELGVPHRIGPLFYGLLAILAGWCAAVMALFGRRDGLIA
jgi:hypothetical protein